MTDFDLTRRRFLTGLTAVAALTATGGRASATSYQGTDDPFPLPPFNYSKLPPEFRRQIVPYTGRHRPGTIIVDTGARHLFLVQTDGTAIRYGCAVGRDGFR